MSISTYFHSLLLKIKFLKIEQKLKILLVCLAFEVYTSPAFSKNF